MRATQPFWHQIRQFIELEVPAFTGADNDVLGARAMKVPNNVHGSLRRSSCGSAGRFVPILDDKIVHLDIVHFRGTFA
jgi:hypothetical protein